MGFKAQLDKGYAGQIANAEPNTLVSRTIEDADGLGFGVAVVRGAEDSGVRGVQAGDTAIFGITARVHSIRKGNAYGHRETASIMKKGVINVEAGVSVSAGDPVFVVPADGTFTNVASGNTVLANAESDESGDAGALVKVRMG